MGDDLAAANVNRAYSLAAKSIAIFTFLLFFLYPMYARGEVGARLFLAPSLILFAVALPVVAAAWSALWLVYVLFVIRHFPRVQTARRG